ncbi:hypothetical protein ACPF04_06020 [Campylobacter sp. MOP51]|uniref:hypothetical protein n=1 Tax=Campylobacter canis TaxID=3378588 RepID=UPI003C518095
MIHRDGELFTFLSPAFLKKILILWDLDGTLVDSRHRTRVDENGGFDLDYWLKHCTAEFINQDQLLPLAAVFYSFANAGFTQILLTARVLGEADHEYLNKHNMKFDMILHRENSLELDEMLKSQQIQNYLVENDLIPFLAFDDKQENLEVFDRLGFRTMHASYVNEKLRIGCFSELKDLLPKQFVK